MSKRIIAVFHDAKLLRSHADALVRAGYQVCPAFNLTELRGHLALGGCDVIVLGPIIPPAEKLRIANFVAQSPQPNCTLIEIFDLSPDLKKAHIHLQRDGGGAALVKAVAQL